MISEKTTQSKTIIVFATTALKVVESNVFLRQKAVNPMDWPETVTLISIVLFHAKRIPPIPARYPMLNILSPSGPGSLWALATLTNLNRENELLLYYCRQSFHTWTEWRRMFRSPYYPPRSTPIMASHNMKTHGNLLLQWSESVWRQPRLEFWLQSGGTWRQSGGWRLNRTVCFWSVCRSEQGLELSGSDRGNTSGGTLILIWGDTTDRMNNTEQRIQVG